MEKWWRRRRRRERREDESAEMSKWGRDENTNLGSEGRRQIGGGRRAAGLIATAVARRGGAAAPRQRRCRTTPRGTNASTGPFLEGRRRRLRARLTVSPVERREGQVQRLLRRRTRI